MKLDGRVVLVTGGGSGIGFALARRFVQAGSTVLVCGRRQAQLEAAQRACPGLHVLRCDLASEAERVAFAEQVQRDYGALDVLVNNAGVQQRPPSLLEPQDWAKHRAELEINLRAPMHLTYLLLGQLRQQPSAAIVNVSSGLAFVPIAFLPTYCATKAALHSFTLSLRYQLADTRVEVIEVVPPMVNTDLGGKGLHDNGAPLDDYADDVMKQLATGQSEFGYQFSEIIRNAPRAEQDKLFALMNDHFAKGS
ncbi:MAG: SDR family NAD(P)-dependent oxidoreductase [Polyangiales bacterium]